MTLTVLMESEVAQMKVRLTRQVDSFGNPMPMFQLTVIPMTVLPPVVTPAIMTAVVTPASMPSNTPSLYMPIVGGMV